MGNIRFVTLTGAGEKTDFVKMAKLSEAHHWVEWGVLYSPSRAGLSSDPRYPSLQWLEKFATFANEQGMNIALHVCGKAVNSLLEHAHARLDGPEAPADVQRLFALAERFGRVQLNMRASTNDVEGLRRVAAQLTRTERRTRTILQWNSHNEPVCKTLSFMDGFEVLVDSSYGRGVEPASWPLLRRDDYRRLGYAGGLGPDNLLEQLAAIHEVAGDRMYWVDMEGKLRDTSDQFDLTRCEQVLGLAKTFIHACERATGALHGDGFVRTVDLDDYWLDWWVAEACCLDVVVPPANACRTMLFNRQQGSYEGFSPLSEAYTANRLFQQERIALMPKDTGWEAFSVESPNQRSTGDTMAQAGLRAIVRKHFGEQVPRNPID